MAVRVKESGVGVCLTQFGCGSDGGNQAVLYGYTAFFEERPAIVVSDDAAVADEQSRGLIHCQRILRIGAAQVL